MDARRAVVTAWDEAVAHWDDPARHDALLGAGRRRTAASRGPPARYRERAGDPIADKHARAPAQGRDRDDAARPPTVRPDDAKLPYRNVDR